MTSRRWSVRRSVRGLLVCSTLVLLLGAPASASATISSVLGNVTCQVQTSGSTAGQRWCTDGPQKSSITPSWDGTPIDVAVAFPPASGTDRSWPVVGVFHGWGGTKIEPQDQQRWLNQGYAVFSMTDRGWGNSCGGPSSTVKSGACARGYVHLMANAYEVRDAQYLLGELADEGLIDPQRIGVTGASYGGGLSVQLGALKDRVMLPNHSLIPWRSPVKHYAMRIAASAPEIPWTDLLQALFPNGSGLDYVADAPYQGPLGDHRMGIEKRNWDNALYSFGFGTGYLDPASDGDQSANMENWISFGNSGGPYDGQPLATQELNELPFHSAYYTDLSEAPAPALLSSGWNDDLFPVDETVRYYNKVRSVYPTAAIQLFYLDFGHDRGGADRIDGGKLTVAENEWFNYYVKGQGSQPPNAQGGVRAFTSVCPTGNAGTEYDAPNWASLAQGEVRLDSAAQQQVSAPGTPPANSFTSTNVCATQPDGDNASAAEYRLPAASGSFTIAGAPTVIADLSVPGANDQLIARLYDDNVAAGTEQLIGRAIYRPLNPGGGFSHQVFQLHPQAWQVQPGHVVKLELLTSDSPYALNSSSPDSIQVKNLELRIPTVDPPGSAGGLVQSPLPRYLPPGYRLAEDFTTTVPGVPQLTSGGAVNAGQFTLSWSPSDPAADLRYTLQHQDASGSGWSDVSSSLSSPQVSFGPGSPEAEGTWIYRVGAHQADGSAATDFSAPSAPVKVDLTPPNAPTLNPDRPPDYSGDGGWWKDSVTVTVTDNGDPNLRDGSTGSGVNSASVPGPFTHSSSGTFTDAATVTDDAGNGSAQSSFTVQVDATPPALRVTCPSAVPLNAGGVFATVTASDGESGLAVDPSGSIAIDTSSVGAQTVTRTATDNVGHSVTGSCTTQVVAHPTVFTSTNPASVSNDDAPAVIGFAPAGSTVSLYTTADCSGAPLATGSASTFASPGIAVTVPHDTTTTFHATATDSGGTSACSPDSISYVEDSTPPSISINGHPNVRTSSTSATLSFSADEGATFQCKLDSGSFADCTSPQSYSSLAIGAHTFQVQGTDAAGNTSTPASLTWTIDQSAPTASILTPAGGGAYSLGQTVATSYSCSDPDGAGDVASCSGPVASGGPLDTSTTGLHAFTVRAVDQAGNTSLVSSGYTIYAAGGSGTLGAAPKLVSALTTHQTVTLTYTAAAGGMLNGSLAIVVPTGWSAPSTVPTASGYTSASRGTLSATGQTLTLSGLTMSPGQRVKITYGSTAGGGPGASTPASPAGAQTWQAQESSVTAAPPTSLPSAPTVTVYAANGSGTLATGTTSVPHATAQTLVFTYAVATGGISGGALTLAVPSGWSAPSTVPSAAGYTTSTRGRVSVAGQTIIISGLTRSAGQMITITYGRRTAGGPGASAPGSPVAAQTWQAQESSVTGGSPTNLANPPQISVT